MSYECVDIPTTYLIKMIMEVNDSILSNFVIHKAIFELIQDREAKNEIFKGGYRIEKFNFHSDAMGLVSNEIIDAKNDLINLGVIKKVGSNKDRTKDISFYADGENKLIGYEDWNEKNTLIYKILLKKFQQILIDTRSDTTDIIDMSYIRFPEQVENSVYVYEFYNKIDTLKGLNKCSRFDCTQKLQYFAEFVYQNFEKKSNESKLFELTRDISNIHAYKLEVFSLFISVVKKHFGWYLFK